MAVRHQYAQCYRYYAKEPIDLHALHVGTGSVVKLSCLQNGPAISQAFGDFSLSEDIYMANSVSVHGTTYRPGMMLVVSVDDEGLYPTFAKIQYIFVNSV